MKKLFLILILMLLVPTLLFSSMPSEEIPFEILIEDFSPKNNPSEDSENFTPTSGFFPNDWKYRNDNALKTYGVIKENDNYFLRARSYKTGTQILKKFQSEIDRHQVLSWKWRVNIFPGEKSNIDKRSRDNGASIYVIFGGFWSRKALKYTWSNHFTKGTYIDSRSSMKTIVLRDQTDPKNVWLEENINIYEDFKKYFKKDPSKLTAIALMTDSDQTKSVAEADYEDFILRKSLPEKALDKEKVIQSLQNLKEELKEKEKPNTPEENLQKEK